MKKFSIIAILTALTVPALAVDDVAPKTDDATVAENTEVVTEQETEQVAEPETISPSNPKIKFPHGLQLGVGVSATSGLNGFVGYANKNFDSFWWKRFGVRFDFATTKPLKSTINSAVDKVLGDDGYEITDGISIIDGTIKSQHMAALVDFYPFGNTWFLGGWRLTGGYVFGKMDMDANLKGTLKNMPGEIEFELWHQKYKYKGDNTVYGTATADWKFNGPYAGTGFDLGLLWGIKIYMDAGVVFTNKAAQLDLNIPIDDLASNLYIGDGHGGWNKFEVPGDTPEYIAAKEEFIRNKDMALKDAQDELNKYKFYPIVKLGFMYRF